MKRKLSLLCYILFFLTILFMTGKLLLSFIGYTIELFSIPVFSVLLAGLSICIVVLDIVYKNTIEDKALRVFMAIITPLSMLNAALYLLVCGELIVLISTTLCTCCCLYLGIKHGKPLALKIVALALAAMMFWPMCILSFLSILPIGKNTVIKTVESPNGNYYAELIDSDQGALGGDTLVVVHHKRGLNLLLFAIKKKSQTVYLGPWGQRNKKIYWKDEHCVVVDSVEHPIK